MDLDRIDEVVARHGPELFRTVHGSHLYGLAHAGSDRDLMIVVAGDTGGILHVKTPERDANIVGWRDLMRYAAEGSHQSCETVFSGRKQFTRAGIRYLPLLEGMRVGGAATSKYERTIKRFAFGDFKRRRHAVRLAFNLRDLRRHGRFDPELTAIQRSIAMRIAARYEGEELALMLTPGVTFDEDVEAA